MLFTLFSPPLGFFLYFLLIFPKGILCNALKRRSRNPMMNGVPKKKEGWLKRAYDRNFPRDQLFCDVGKLRCNESYFFGHIIVICLLGLLAKLNKTEGSKTVLILRIFQKIHQCQSFWNKRNNS